VKWSALPSRKRARDGHPRSLAPESFRAAPACDEPRAKAGTRFRRSERGVHDAAPHFFYPWPLFAQPALDFVFVLLARLESRLLRCNASFREPLAQVVRMELDVPLAIDHLRDAGRGPQFRGKTELGGRTLEPTQDLALLPGCELSRTARGIASRQGRIASTAKGLHPAAHRAGPNAQELRDGTLSVARQHAADAQPSPSFQFFLETWSPHAYIYACPIPPVHFIAFFS